MAALLEEFAQLPVWMILLPTHQPVSVWLNALSILCSLLTVKLTSVFKYVKMGSDKKSTGLALLNVPTSLSTLPTKSFTWLIVPINSVFCTAQMSWFPSRTTKTINVLKDAQMVLLPTTLLNNAFPNVPLYPMTHSHKIHPTSACSNVQSVVMEVHKIFIVS